MSCVVALFSICDPRVACLLPAAGEAAGDMESAPLLGSKDKESESVMWLDEGSVSAEVMIGRRSTENPRRTWTVRVASAALVVL